MKRIHQNLKGIIFALVLALCFFLLLSMKIPKAAPLLSQSKSKVERSDSQKEVLRLVAIGDSLTEGIGDTTNSGGYVPLISQSLTETYKLNAVETDNFGVSGNRSDQILKRIKNKTDIQKSLKSADVIVLTVGGNDLMKIVKSKLLNGLTTDSFTKPMAQYKKRLENIFKEIRQYNETAPIYLFGIYNPFYVYFSDITEMQDIVDNWNDTSQSTAEQEGNSYFIPINDLLYNGSGITENTTDSGTGSSSGSTSNSAENDLIFEKDHFHPNNLGYQIMANALRDKMAETKKKWLDKE